DGRRGCRRPSPHARSLEAWRPLPRRLPLVRLPPPRRPPCSTPRLSGRLAWLNPALHNPRVDSSAWIGRTARTGFPHHSVIRGRTADRITPEPNAWFAALVRLARELSTG